MFLLQVLTQILCAEYYAQWYSDALAKWKIISKQQLYVWVCLLHNDIIWIFHKCHMVYFYDTFMFLLIGMIVLNKKVFFEKKKIRWKFNGLLWIIVRSHLHSLLSQVCPFSQLLSGVDVRVLVLSEEFLQSVQLIFCEDGSMATNPPLNMTVCSRACFC